MSPLSSGCQAIDAPVEAINPCTDRRSRPNRNVCRNALIFSQVARSTVFDGVGLGRKQSPCSRMNIVIEPGCALVDFLQRPSMVRSRGLARASMRTIMRRRQRRAGACFERRQSLPSPSTKHRLPVFAMRSDKLQATGSGRGAADPLSAKTRDMARSRVSRPFSLDGVVVVSLGTMTATHATIAIMASAQGGQTRVTR